MIPRDYEWLHKHNCSVSFNHKENVIRKTHLLELGWSLKANPVTGCNHPHQLLEGGRGEKPSISQRFLALHYQNLSLLTPSTDWSWVKPGQNSFSRHGGKENITAGTGMLLNGVFDMQDQELFKTPPVLVYPAGFCQAFRAAEIQHSLWWGLWSPRGCAWQPHQRPGEGNSQGSVGPELGDGQGRSPFCCCDLCCEQRDVT